MIQFECSQCGKSLSRPKSQAGSLIFCSCGQSNRVPWPTETDAEPEGVALEVTLEDALPAEPEAVPPTIPIPPRPPVPREVARPSEPAEQPTFARSLPTNHPRRLLGKINPDYCYNHLEDASETTCCDCRLPLCSRCVVNVFDRTICGPCKNFRFAVVSPPRRLFPQATLAFVTAVTSGPVSFILSFTAVGTYQSEGLLAGAVLLCVLAAILPSLAVLLSWRALCRIDEHPNSSGQGLASSALCLGMVSLLWSATVVLVLVGKHALPGA